MASLKGSKAKATGTKKVTTTTKTSRSLKGSTAKGTGTKSYYTGDPSAGN